MKLDICMQIHLKHLRKNSASGFAYNCPIRYLSSKDSLLLSRLGFYL